jgi:hypothetical protein
MVKKILVVVLMLFAGNMGWANAQAVHSTSRFDIRDRVEYQRNRINEGLADKTITQAHARYCLATLSTVENRLKHETVQAMTQKEYETYNQCLDANSAYIHESKQAFYYHDPLFSMVMAEFKI